MLLVEAIPPELAEAITKIVTIPVLGIGAGAKIDGQVLIISMQDQLMKIASIMDDLGEVEDEIKKYANVAKVITDAMKEYVDDVHDSKFPAPEHTYSVLPEEKEKFDGMLKKYIK